MKELLITLAIFLTAYASNSQTPLSSDDLISYPGLTFELSISNTSADGTPGENQIWDFTNILAANVETNDIAVTELESTGFEDDFPNANTTSCNAFIGVCEYFSIEENGYFYHGLTDGVFINATSDPLQFTLFPMAFGENFYDEFVLAPQSNAASSGSYEASIDGYGTLQLPLGDIEQTYRVSGDYYEEALNIIDGDTTTTVFEMTIISFFAPGFPGPVLQSYSGQVYIESVDMTVNISDARYVQSIILTTDEPEIVEDLTVFPNPTAGNTTVRFENRSHQQISIEILDIRGRVVHTAPQVGTATGLATIDLDLADLNPGVYLLRMGNGKSFQTEKIQITR